jgi:hypothetical protein
MPAVTLPATESIITTGREVNWASTSPFWNQQVCHSALHELQFEYSSESQGESGNTILTSRTRPRVGHDRRIKAIEAYESIPCCRLSP